jgi:parallel beta-helix repeat protein
MRMREIAIVGAAFCALVQPVLAKTIAVAPGDGAQERLQEALIAAEPGDVVELGAGRFVLTDGLSLDVARVTVKGQGVKETILDFSGQQGSGEGLLVTSDDVVLRDFAVENSKGDGIKSKGADRIVYHRLRVEWTGGPKETNGAYGVYPVESKDVLIDSVIVRGASDAGIYVGQSRNIVVRGSTVTENVAGIEIENSYDADVHDNIATHNTGGVLVFDLPNLPQMGGRNVRVFDNIIGGNGTSNIMVVGYRFEHKDATYDPLPQNVVIWDNQHGRAGWDPKFRGGTEIAAAMGGSFPAIFWDGAGGEARAPVVMDSVPALSLGLTDIKADPITAKPAPLAAATARPAALPAIVLPETMEAAVR